jgi:hypothetical protein
MAIPTFVSAAAVSSGTAAITPALPGSILADDILILGCETRGGQALALSDEAGGDWSLASSPNVATQFTGTTAGDTRLTVAMSRYNGTQTAPTIADAGDHQIAGIIAVRGCIASGAPHEAPVGGTKTSTSTTVAVTGSTTTGSDRLVVVVCSRKTDAAGAFFSNWANADLANVTERFDDGGTSGVGGGFAIVLGEKAVAGAYGDTNADMLSTDINAFVTFALIPAGAAAAAPPSRLINLMGCG